MSDRTKQTEEVQRVVDQIGATGLDSAQFMALALWALDQVRGTRNLVHEVEAWSRLHEEGVREIFEGVR